MHWSCSCAGCVGLLNLFLCQNNCHGFRYHSPSVCGNWPCVWHSEQSAPKVVQHCIEAIWIDLPRSVDHLVDSGGSPESAKEFTLNFEPFFVTEFCISIQIESKSGNKSNINSSKYLVLSICLFHINSTHFGFGHVLPLAGHRTSSFQDHYSGNMSSLHPLSRNSWLLLWRNLNLNQSLQHHCHEKSPCHWHAHPHWNWTPWGVQRAKIVSGIQGNKNNFITITTQFQLR